MVLKYQDRLFNTVFHVVGHAEDARDIVQEALVQAFLKLDSFERRSAFYTWLYRIAFNAAVAHRRRRTTVSIDACGKPNPTTPAADGPAERLEGKERCSQVRHALTQLPAEQRAVLVLREIDGCDYETIAEILDAARRHGSQSIASRATAIARGIDGRAGPDRRDRGAKEKEFRVMLQHNPISSEP